MSVLPLRLLSHLWPVRVARYRGRTGPLELAWEQGRLVVNSPNANQSHGSLQRLWELLFAERIELRAPHAGSVLLLGLGAGGIVRLLQGTWPKASITAVEHDPVMITLARDRFGVYAGPRLHIVQADAFRSLRANTSRFDLVLVDLFEDHLLPAALFEASTFSGLANALAPGGSLFVNTMEGPARARTLQGLAEGAGLRVEWASPLPDNRVLIARSS